MRHAVTGFNLDDHIWCALLLAEIKCSKMSDGYKCYRWARGFEKSSFKTSKQRTASMIAPKDNLIFGN